MARHLSCGTHGTLQGLLGPQLPICPKKGCAHRPQCSKALAVCLGWGQAGWAEAPGPTSPAGGSLGTADTT